MQLHELFEEILLNALPSQIERERNKVVKPNQYHPETYLEIHENAEELQYRHDEYVGGRFR